MQHLASVEAARPVLRQLWREGRTIGTVHTLGALHRAHAELIRRAAAENDVAIVTVYPNRIQLFPGSIYEYDLAEDCDLAFANGARIVISSQDAEMYPAGYATTLDQGPAQRRLNSSVFDFATRGQVTGAIRWISLTRPTRTYFGLKDIEQALLVERAVRDLLIDCQVRHVPCVRTPAGVPISSRLRALDPDCLAEVAGVHAALQSARELVAAGQRDPAAVAAHLEGRIRDRLRTFELVYATVVDAAEFADLGLSGRVALPFVLHACVRRGGLHHFDGLLVRSERDLAEGPETIWIE